jgi:hypothetical protein
VFLISRRIFATGIELLNEGARDRISHVHAGNKKLFPICRNWLIDHRIHRFGCKCGDIATFELRLADLASNQNKPSASRSIRVKFFIPLRVSSLMPGLATTICNRGTLTRIACRFPKIRNAAVGIYDLTKIIGRFTL